MSLTETSETARLAKLFDYQILDTAPEREFDDIAAAAARLFNAPMSAVSLIDRDRQWFKARYGIGASETPRDQAFCAHTIKGDDLFVVEDATKDPRFSENPLVTGDLNIRYYVGAPLITPDNQHLGSLCVIDSAPRAAPNEDLRNVLTLLARLVVRELEIRRVARRAEHQAKMVSRLTEAMVTLAQANSLPEIAKIVADNTRRLAIADVARVSFGHGTDAAAVVLSQRTEGASLPAIPWAALDSALGNRPAGQPLAKAPADIILPSGGAWLGVRLGGPGSGSGNAVATLQVWRRLTASFTEMEVGILTDLARVASAMVGRLPAGS